MVYLCVFVAASCSEWSDWSDCTEACGGGIEQRVCAGTSGRPAVLSTEVIQNDSPLIIKIRGNRGATIQSPGGGGWVI